MPLVLTDIQYAVWLNLDYVIVGRFLGDAALGIYTLAYRLPELLVQSIWRVVARGGLPLLLEPPGARLDLLRRGFLKTIRYSQLVVVPLCLGLLITADPAVGVLFGDQWTEAVPVLRVLALFTLVASIGVNVGDVYKAIGRPDILAKLGPLDLVVLTPAPDRRRPPRASSGGAWPTPPCPWSTPRPAPGRPPLRRGHLPGRWAASWPRLRCRGRSAGRLAGRPVGHRGAGAAAPLCAPTPWRGGIAYPLVLLRIDRRRASRCARLGGPRPPVSGARWCRDGGRQPAPSRLPPDPAGTVRTGSST